MPDLSNRRICFIAGTLGCGGAERQLAYMLRVLQTERARVSVLSLTEGEFWEEPLLRSGVEIVHVGGDGSRLGRLRVIVREVRRLQPEVLQSGHFFTNMYAALAARMTGVREIGAIRSQVQNEVEAIGGVLGKLSLRLPRVMCANSRAAVERAIIAGVPRERIRFLPNVVDTDWFTPGDRGFDRPVTVLGVGSLRPVKRFDLFLNVIARLHAHGGDHLRAVIVGEGPERERLIYRRDELGLREVVEFPGASEDMRPWYEKADVFLSTSDVEGTPNVVLEAMACGLPIVATDVGDVRSLLPDGFGLVVQPGDELALAVAMSILIESAYTREEFSRRCRAAAMRRNVCSLVQTLRDIYWSVLHPSSDFS